MSNSTKLKQLREAKGFEQKEFAKLIGYKSVSKYNEIENGHKNMPIARAMIAKELLECSLEDIFLPSYFPKREKTEDEK